MHMAARTAGADMMGVLLDALPEAERTELINAADKSGITPVFLAFQRSVAYMSATSESWWHRQVARQCDPAGFLHMPRKQPTTWCTGWLGVLTFNKTGASAAACTKTLPCL